MRIAAVTTWYPSPADPVEGLFVARHVEALRRDHDVRVLHLGSRPVADEPGVRHLVLDRRDPRSVLRAARAVARLAAGADVLHTHAFSTLLLVPPARRRVPWLHSEHWSGVSDPVSGGPVWARLAGARRVLDRPDAVTAVSSYLADAVAPFRRDATCHVVPNVVPAPAALTPRPDAGTLRLFAVGNLRPVKDPLLAVETVAELRRRGRAASLRWVGAGPLAEAVRARAAALAVPLELLGRIPPAEFEPEWAGCDVFLLPSEYETFCVAGAEALVHGRPAVLGNRGGMTDFTGPGVELVGERTAAAFADAVERAAARRTPAEEIAAPVRTAYSPAAVADAFAPVLAALTSRR